MDSYKINHERLVTPAGFDAEFYKILPHFNVQEEAFTILNEAYNQKYGTYKYANFNSYRVARNRRLKK